MAKKNNAMQYATIAAAMMTLWATDPVKAAEVASIYNNKLYHETSVFEALGISAGEEDVL